MSEPKDRNGTIEEHASADDFAATLARLKAAIGNAGLTIFAEIDHAAAARDVGMTMLPATVLIYGNPRGGTPVMQAVPRTALDLPLRVLVREDDDGRVLVGFHPIGASLRNAGVADQLAAKLEAAQTLLTKGLAS